MATFKYNALISSGRLMKGVIEAASKEQASQLLEQMELTVNSIELAKPEKLKTAIGRSEFLLFNQQLASITKAGVPLERGLRELSNDISSRSMRKLINAISSDLEAGVSIEQAFEKRQKHFPPLYGRILKAGVETGKLPQMLTSLNRHLEMSNHTRKIIFDALCYPTIVLAMAAVILTGVFLFVVPEFKDVLYEMAGGAQLPLLTQVVLNTTDNIAIFWSVVGLFAAAIVAFFLGLSSSVGGRKIKEWIIWKTPIIGRIYHTGTLSKMAEAMAMMVSTGCDMPACLRLSSSSSGSDILIGESELLARQVEQGNYILEAGHFCRMIPRLFLYSVQLGTQRNELQDNLYDLGQMYSEQAQCSQSRLEAVLLPILIVILGIIISMIVLAMFLPMIKIVTTLSV